VVSTRKIIHLYADLSIYNEHQSVEERWSLVEIEGEMKTSKEETTRNEQEEETRSGKKVKHNTD
jgi:hypothetical protein